MCCYVAFFVDSTTLRNFFTIMSIQDTYVMLFRLLVMPPQNAIYSTSFSNFCLTRYDSATDIQSIERKEPHPVGIPTSVTWGKDKATYLTMYRYLVPTYEQFVHQSQVGMRREINRTSSSLELRCCGIESINHRIVE